MHAFAGLTRICSGSAQSCFRVAIRVTDCLHLAHDDHKARVRENAGLLTVKGVRHPSDVLHQIVFSDRAGSWSVGSYAQSIFVEPMPRKETNETL